MLNRFHVTFDTVTHESAECGDVESSGFVDEGGNLWDMADSPVGPAFAPIKAEHGLRLREALDLLSCLEDGGDGSSYYEADGRTDYRSGSSTRFAFHLPYNATPSSVARVARLLESLGLVRPYRRRSSGPVRPEAPPDLLRDLGIDDGSDIAEHDGGVTP